MSTFTQPEITITLTHQGVSPLQEIIETIYGDGLAEARSKLIRVHREKPIAELLQRPEFLEYFKYSLAKGLANVLTANHEGVMAVYLIEPSLNPDAESGEYLPMDGTIHLILVVKSQTAGLEAYLASLDRVLAQHLRTLPSPLFSARDWITDAVLIPQEDIRRGTGSSNLLTGIYSPPIKVWERN